MRALLPRPGGRWWAFEEPREIVEAWEVRDVVPACRRAEAATDQGLWAVGFLRYEAAPGFDPGLTVRPAGSGLPLVRWAIHPRPRAVAAPRPRPLPDLAWTQGLSREEHRLAIETIRAAIERGDTYQANLTFPLLAGWDREVEPIDWSGVFARLFSAQRSGRAILLEDDRHAILSLSPELFLERRGPRVRSEPIKGTAARGRHPAEDAALRAELAGSAKERAENVMIVDMVRNDLGRVAVPGTVRVSRLCEVRSWQTVHQLVSRVEARVEAGWTDLLAATFPCASITGAPKRRTMELLAGLEPHPRGLYTGAIGVWAPGRRGRLNVAIRTLVADREARTVRYGTGGGIVWDSDPDAEWRECGTKSQVLLRPNPDFRYLETLLWTPARGFVLLDLHLARLAAAADRFADRAVRTGRIRARLAALGPTLGPGRTRVRLLVARDGSIRCEAASLPARPLRELRIRLDDRPVDPRDPFLFHKTSRRERYEDALARFPGADDVLLWNPDGEITECTRANVALRSEGCWWTPPVESGLLAGTLRRRLLARGRLRERRLRLDSLEEAPEILVFNSVRGFARARIDTGG